MSNIGIEAETRERATVISVAVLFLCVVALFVIIIVLVIVLVKERNEKYNLSQVNSPFKSQVYVPMDKTNRLFTGYEDVDFVCISMEHRKDTHYERLRSQLEVEGIELEWFKGINGKNLNPDDYNLAPRYRNFFKNNLKEFFAGHTKTDYRGHLGCTVSHLNVISHLKNMTVIFEDDAEIVPNFREKFQSVLAALTRHDPTWQLLLLGFCCRYSDHGYCKLNDREPVHEGGLVKLHYWIGGWAYCIRDRAAADHILELFNPMPWHIDLTMAEAARKGDLRVYGCIPTLCNHAGWLRSSSWDFWQIGDTKFIKSDTNNEIPNHIA